MMSAVDPYKIDSISIPVADIRTMILLLDAPEVEAVRGVLEWATKFAETSVKNRLQLLNLKIVPLLLKLASVKNPVIRKLIASCLAAVSEIGEIHAELRSKELIHKLINFLGPDEHFEVQDAAAMALGLIAKDYPNKVEIRKANGMKYLLRLLTAADPDVKKNAAFALNNLLDDYASRTELRLLNGFPPILELLHADHPEIVENGLHCLIRCSEDGANRVEIRKAQGLKKMLTVVEHPSPSVVVLALQCISNCLDDVETNLSIADYNGIPEIVGLLSAGDSKVKANAEITLYKIAKQDKNIGYIREAGGVPALLANLGLGFQGTPISTSDYPTIGNAALAISGLARNEMNQNDVVRGNGVEILIKLLGLDNSEIRKSTLLCLSQLCFHSAKVRAKMRTMDGVKAIVGSLQTALALGKDPLLIANAVECVSSLAEDVPDRVEITKLMGVQMLVSALKFEDQHLQIVTTMALARVLQDAEARAQFYDAKGCPLIFRLLTSNNDDVCRYTTWALSNAALAEPIALDACNMGALENLLTLSKSPTRNIAQFAIDALEKILNFHLPAKYWLRNALSAENVIKDGFYDVGAYGSSRENFQGFPTLEALAAAPVDKKREVLLVSRSLDLGLVEFQAKVVQAIQDTVKVSASAATTGLTTTRVQILKLVAEKIAEQMGGTATMGDLKKSDDFGCKFHVAELKLKRRSNVIPISSIRKGTFYHRSLLFKYIVDQILHAESSRKKEEPAATPVAAAATSNVPPPATATNPTTTPVPGTGATTTVASPSTSLESIPAIIDARTLVSKVTLVRGEYGRAWNAVNLKPYELQESATAIELAKDVPNYGAREEEYVVDLMFKPGTFLKQGSKEAIAYQRISE